MTFQRLMEALLHGLHWSTCLIYLDDCIVGLLGKNFDDHLYTTSRMSFNASEKPVLNWSHPNVSSSVRYTWAINTDGVLPDPNNINKVASWPRPQNPTHVRSFLGLASFYHHFIMNFSKIASRLTNLTHKGMKFNWTEKCEDSFNTLKRALINPPLLAYPDFSVEFSPSTDAFLTAIGAVLSQVKKGKERVVAFFSQKLTTTQQKWSTYNTVLWAIVASVHHFRHYLRGKESLPSSLTTNQSLVTTKYQIRTMLLNNKPDGSSILMPTHSTSDIVKASRIPMQMLCSVYLQSLNRPWTRWMCEETPQHPLAKQWPRFWDFIHANEHPLHRV